MTDQPSTTDVVSPVEGDTTADPRRARVDTARAAWTRHLVDLGGRNTLLWYRDLPTGTLDLTTAHPGGVAMLLAGKPTGVEGRTSFPRGSGCGPTERSGDYEADYLVHLRIS